MSAKDVLSMAEEPLELGRSPSHLLHRAQQISTEKVAGAVRDAGLTHRQYVVLNAVAAGEGLTQTALVQITGIDRSTLAELVSRMAQRKLLSRSRAAHDARANIVSLTAQGRQALQNCMQAAVEADRAVLDVLPAARREGFLQMLAILAGEAEAEKAEKPSASDASPPRKSVKPTKKAPAASDDDAAKKKKKKKKKKKAE